MRSYRVKQVAQMAGVSVRTLHHYDQIGLLEPAYIGENNYRYYTRDELMKLHQILFFKEMGLSLDDIAKALEMPDTERAQLLVEHKQKLQIEARRQKQLIKTIDRTIDELMGNETMKVEDLYKGFSEEKQSGYEQWLAENYGPDVERSVIEARNQLESASGKNALIERRMLALQEIENDLILALQSGIGSDDTSLEPIIERHHSWVAQWWLKQPDQQSYIGLSQLYQSHPDFVARYEALAPGLTAFLVDAMVAFAKKHLE